MTEEVKTVVLCTIGSVILGFVIAFGCMYGTSSTCFICNNSVRKNEIIFLKEKPYCLKCYVRWLNLPDVKWGGAE